jgi:hypothetical protein
MRRQPQRPTVEHMTTITAEGIGVALHRRLRLTAAVSALALFGVGGFAVAATATRSAGAQTVPPAVFLAPTDTEAGK